MVATGTVRCAASCTREVSPIRDDVSGGASSSDPAHQRSRVLSGPTLLVCWARRRKLSIYELDSVSPAIDGVPGLVGPDELARLGMILDFTDGALEALGERSDIIPGVG